MQQINFYQTQFQPKKTPLPARQIGIWLLLVLITLIAFSLYMGQQVKVQTKLLTSKQQRYDNSHKQLLELQKQLGEKTTNPLLEAQIKQLQQQIKHKEIIQSYLDKPDFSDHGGFISTLEGLGEQSIKGVWLTSFSLLNGGKYITLRGTSTQPNLIPEYIDSLAKSEQFKGKQFSVFKMQQPPNQSSYYNFDLHSQPSEME